METWSNVESVQLSSLGDATIQPTVYIQRIRIITYAYNLDLTWKDSPNPNIPYANINSPEAIANTSPDGSRSLNSPYNGDSYREGVYT